LLGEANDELDRYKEKNYDQLYIEAFLREDLVDLRKQIEAANKIFDQALDRNKYIAQPQDMKIRLTFEFGEFEQLRNALLFPRKESQKEETPLCPYCGELTTQVESWNDRPAYSCFKCKRVASCNKDYLEERKEEGEK
jgi:hypothetical protein